MAGCRITVGAVAGRLDEVAGYAGVSLATASRVLNGRPGVAEGTRRAVLAAVDVLGYQRPAVLAQRRIGLVGLVVAELDNPVFPLFAQALERALSAFGYGALLSTRQFGLPAEQASIELLREHGVAGLVFVSGVHSDTHADPEDYVRLREQRIPLAFINGYIPELDATFVADDDAAGMDAVVRHLVALGHDHIGLATGPIRYTPSARKLAGFQAAMSAHAPHARAEHHVGDYSLESGRVAAIDLVGRGCTAVVGASDFTALGAIRGVRSLGLDVPGDVSVTGYDGSSLMEFTDPPLTGLRQAVDRLASGAVRSLIEDIEGSPRSGTELLYQPELIVRASTGPPPASGNGGSQPPG